MASPQIEQLRKQFNSMNVTQKKQFITGLKQKLQGNSNPEYTKFLNECVQQYNTAVRGGSAVPTATTSTSSPVAAKSKRKKSPFKWIAICLTVIILGGVGGLFLINNSSLENNIVGMWQSENNDKTIYVFDKNGSYSIYSSDIRAGTYIENNSNALKNYRERKPSETGRYVVGRADKPFIRLIPEGIANDDYDNHKEHFGIKITGGNVLTEQAELRDDLSPIVSYGLWELRRMIVK